MIDLKKFTQKWVDEDETLTLIEPSIESGKEIEIELISINLKWFREAPFEEQVNALNSWREMLHSISPFKDNPVDLIKWVKADEIVANDYNPNVVARVNGANGGALYMQEWGNISGYRKITKPPGHTWKSFAELLISSMPNSTGRHYQNKILLFQKWHLERGYPDGIPDEAPYELESARRAPSWRRICKSLLRNDWWCKGLGFSQQKSSGYKKYLDLMERRKYKWSVGHDIELASDQLELLEPAE